MFIKCSVLSSVARSVFYDVQNISDYFYNRIDYNCGQILHDQLKLIYI